MNFEECHYKAKHPRHIISYANSSRRPSLSRITRDKWQKNRNAPTQSAYTQNFRLIHPKLNKGSNVCQNYRSANSAPHPAPANTAAASNSTAGKIFSIFSTRIGADLILKFNSSRGRRFTHGPNGSFHPRTGNRREAVVREEENTATTATTAQVLLSDVIPWEREMR